MEGDRKSAGRDYKVFHPTTAGRRGKKQLTAARWTISSVAEIGPDAVCSNNSALGILHLTSLTRRTQTSQAFPPRGAAFQGTLQHTNRS